MIETSPVSGELDEAGGDIGHPAHGVGADHGDPGDGGDLVTGAGVQPPGDQGHTLPLHPALNTAAPAVHVTILLTILVTSREKLAAAGV